MSESASTGWTTSKEPNANAAAWKAYARNATPIEAHHAGRRIERSGEAPARMMRWRHTVPAAIVAAEISARIADR